MDRDDKGRFTTGHSFGWRKGQSGNPAGGRKISFTRLLRERLEQGFKVSVYSGESPNGEGRLTTEMSEAQAIVFTAVQRAIDGDHHFAKMIIDRLDGLPVQELPINAHNDEIETVDDDILAAVARAAQAVSTDESPDSS